MGVERGIEKEEDWGVERREIEGTGAHTACIILNSNGPELQSSRDEGFGFTNMSVSCSSQWGCMFTERKIQSAESTSNGSSL